MKLRQAFSCAISSSWRSDSSGFGFSSDQLQQNRKKGFTVHKYIALHYIELNCIHTHTYTYEAVEMTFW